MSKVAKIYRMTPEILESGGSDDEDESSRAQLSQSVIVTPSYGICRMETGSFQVTTHRPRM
jgi:hypothetical protein